MRMGTTASGPMLSDSARTGRRPLGEGTKGRAPKAISH